MKRAMRMLVVSMVAVLAIASVGSAKNTTWNNAALDGSYTNSANWDLGAPVAGDTASFTWTSDTAVISTSVYTESLAMGIVGGVPSNLKIVNGGYGHFGSTAPTYGSSAVSYSAGSSANLIVEAGGTADFAWQLTVGQWGNGKVTLDGGTLKVQHLCFNASGGGANSSGLVDVKNGGTLQVNTQLIIAGWNAVGPVMNVAGAGSKILVNAASGWNVGAAEAWANAGFLTGNGLAGAANIVASTVTIGGVAYTQVTAVPEPVTLALLAAGGLFLRRKA